jgi:hypothetical protein
MPRTSGRARAVLLAAVASVALSGCEGIRDQLGLNKNPPDEFQVVSREPLTVPPDFSLRPPEPGAERPQTGSVRDQAEQTVFRQDDDGDADDGFEADAAAANLSAGERAFLAKAGAGRAPDDIRQVLKRETERLEEADQNFVDRLVFWEQPETKGRVVDAEAEAKRLRENSALGKDATEGATPTIERQERGLLEGLLGGE